jgi:hypothetical protein
MEHPIGLSAELRALHPPRAARTKSSIIGASPKPSIKTKINQGYLLLGAPPRRIHSHLKAQIKRSPTTNDAEAAATTIVNKNIY